MYRLRPTWLACALGGVPCGWARVDFFSKCFFYTFGQLENPIGTRWNFILAGFKVVIFRVIRADSVVDRKSLIGCKAGSYNTAPGLRKW